MCYNNTMSKINHNKLNKKLDTERKIASCKRMSISNRINKRKAKSNPLRNKDRSKYIRLKTSGMSEIDKIKFILNS